MTDTNHSPADVAAFLRRYNSWRREGAEEMPAPAEIGRAIDAAIGMLEELAELAKLDPTVWIHCKTVDAIKAFKGGSVWVTSEREEDGDVPLYARPVPAEPVNARLLESAKAALKALLLNCEMQTESPAVHAMAALRASIEAAEAQRARPVRLTSDEINACLARWRSSRHETYENLAWIVEAASLRANGFQVEN